MEDEDSKLKRFGPAAGGAVLIALFLAGVWYLYGQIQGVAAPEPPAVQEISLVQPPPPPPPPPKLEEPPPPEMEEVKVPEPEPEPVAKDEPADEPMPGDELGLDADGVAGADGFGLRAKKGGRGLIGGGDAHKWYAGLIQNDLQHVLADIADIRKGRYAVVVKIWIANDGSVQDSELVKGTGDEHLDKAIERALSSGLRISRAPPDDLPQPIKLRISSRT